MLRRSYPIRLQTLLVAVVCATFLCHADPLRHGAYAQQSGELPSDTDNLSRNEADDVTTLEHLSHAFSVVAELVRPSVVNVEARSSFDISHDELSRLFREHGMPVPPNIGDGTLLPPKRSAGSGVILDADGHIITNNHVVADAEVVDVTLADGRDYRAKVIGTDPMTDLALIKINARRLHPARLGDSDRIKVGNLVFAIGSPFRLGHSVSHGIVSALGRGESMDVGIDYKNWIQTDAPINPGNSGGPLINARGEVIGINTAIATESGIDQGVGFAIPSNAVALIAERLRTGKDVKRGYLGVVIKPITPKWADAYGLDEARGVFIDNVGAETPADTSGLKPEDIILIIGRHKIRTREQLQEAIAATAPGTEVDMSVWRNQSALQLTVRIGSQPEGFSTTGSIQDLTRRRNDLDKDTMRDLLSDTETPSDAGDAAPTEVKIEKLGFWADTVSPKLKRVYGLDRTIQNGALITRVSVVGEAYAAGLRPGLVIVRANDRRINNIRELDQVLTDGAIVKGIRLKIMRPDKEATYAVLRVR